MICEASDFEGCHLVSSRNPANIRPNAMLDFRMDPMDAIFGAEYQVIVERRIGICHLFAPLEHYDPRQISNGCDPEMSERFFVNRRYATELFTCAVPRLKRPG